MTRCVASIQGTTAGSCISQDLETVCTKLAIVIFSGVPFFKVDHNILRYQP